LEPFKRLDSATEDKIHKELVESSSLPIDYSSTITISENSHRLAVAKLASLLNITEEEAREAIGPKDNWRASVTHTDATGPHMSGPLIEDYFKFIENLPYESVSIDLAMLRNFIVDWARFAETTETYRNSVKPKSAYVIRMADNPSEIIALIFPEESEWAGVNAYYKANH